MGFFTSLFLGLKVCYYRGHYPDRTLLSGLLALLWLTHNPW
jgi:hypothetical protein